jgi:hypothetical protein
MHRSEKVICVGVWYLFAKTGWLLVWWCFGRLAIDLLGICCPDLFLLYLREGPDDWLAKTYRFDQDISY